MEDLAEGQDAAKETLPAKERQAVSERAAIREVLFIKSPGILKLAQADGSPCRQRFLILSVKCMTAGAGCKFIKMRKIQRVGSLREIW